MSLASPGSAAALIRDLIAAHGPIDLARYMAIATQAYYAGRDPLGRAGDFTTGPEISQVFGELIGLAVAQAWLDRGRPRPAALVELGPGRGTLLADAARAWRIVPGFQDAVRLHLVETSPTLRALQGERLGALAPVWHEDVGQLPTQAPLFIIANEFLDTFSIRQFFRADSGWRERLVDCDVEGRLGFVLARQAAPIEVVAADGAVLEVAPAREAVAAALAGRLAEQGGMALLIDYGEARTPFLGDTLQAVRGHAALDPMRAPGEADLTSHVDFAAVARATAAAGAAVWGPITQGDFLRRLGIDLRLDRLAAARPEVAAELAAGCRRLTEPEGMGTLFKVLALAGDDLPPPGFDAGERWR